MKQSSVNKGLAAGVVLSLAAAGFNLMDQPAQVQVPDEPQQVVYYSTEDTASEGTVPFTRVERKKEEQPGAAILEKWKLFHVSVGLKVVHGSQKMFDDEYNRDIYLLLKNDPDQVLAVKYLKLTGRLPVLDERQTLQVTDFYYYHIADVLKPAKESPVLDIGSLSDR